MIGLFGILDMGARSLATERQGVEVTGHNLANVNNPAYARQRLNIVTSPTIANGLLQQGTGAETSSISRLRSDLLDDQIQGELSVTGSLTAQQSALESAQAGLGQELDSTTQGTDASSAAGSVGSSHSLGDGLSGLFASFQSLSTNPQSIAERQNVLAKASTLAGQFNQVDQRLAKVNSGLNDSIQTDTTKANSLLTQIADLNDQISSAEVGAPGSANDLRDSRQSLIEDLSKIVKVDLANGNHGAVNVSVSGTLMVADNQVNNTLETFDSGSGQLAVRAAGTSTPLTLTGGSIQGTMEARDGALTQLRQGLNTLASTLISQVNSVHAGGYSLTGSTGANFFSGSDASSIQVNSALNADPSLVQAASVSGAAGDNGTVLALSQLAQAPQSALGNQSLSQGYTQVATSFGQSASAVNTQLSDQQVVQKMLLQQRDSVSGVSLDEEMTNLTLYQKAFEASAKLITTVDTMLDTVINMKVA